MSTPHAFTTLNTEARAEYWATLALRHTPGLGARSCARLLRFFGNARAAYDNRSAWGEAGLHDKKITGLTHNLTNNVWRSKAQDEWTAAQQHNAQIVLWQDKAYPERLRELPDAPVLLYYCGDISLLHAPALAVVGSRDCTDEGVRVVRDIVTALSKSGMAVVSGMAQGIDRIAHTIAMQGPGKSMGVLGTGLDIVYPSRNKDIFELLSTEGLLLTEFAFGTPPLSGHFPIRNRIISGLALGVLVVEATLRSGSLITARLANEQNREVYAIPGPASMAASLGCQELIRQGARPVFNADDILRDLAPQLAHFNIEQQPNIQYVAIAQYAPVAPMPVRVDTKPPMPEGEHARRVLEALKVQDACPVDAICVTTGLSAASVTAVLTELEVFSHVQRLPGGRYRLRNC